MSEGKNIELRAKGLIGPPAVVVGRQAKGGVSMLEARKLIGNPKLGHTPEEIRAIQRRVRKLDERNRPKGAMGEGVYARWALELRDKKGNAVPFGYTRKGKPIWKKQAPCHSFVHNFGIIVRSFLQHLDSAINVREQVTEDDGTVHNLRDKSGHTSNATFATGPAVIKFGAGSGARDATDIDLQGAILASAEGVTTFNLVQETAVSTIMEFEGQVTNNTGGLFTVEEMGIYAQLNESDASANITTLICSDVTGSTAVADGLTILGRYTFTIAV